MVKTGRSRNREVRRERVNLSALSPRCRKNVSEQHDEEVFCLSRAPSIFWSHVGNTGEGAFRSY